MGTRSTVKFISEFNDEPILSVYQQFNGYTSGVGHTLAKFLKDKKILNGFSGHKMSHGFANGMGCLAAQYVADQKTEIGGFYLTTIDDSQEYDYVVRLVDNELRIKVVAYGEVIFNGTPAELLEFK
jgi:hypothetical protein